MDYQGARDAKGILNFAFDKAKALAMKRMGEKASNNGGGGGAGGGGSKSRGGGAGGAPHDEFYSGTDVMPLGADNFESEVVKSKELWLVEVSS